MTHNTQGGLDALKAFQQRVEPWFRECFPPAVCDDRLERGDRLLEEVLELLQSCDYPPERVAALRDYTWGRDKGEPSQEVGGVMVTLAAYCIAHGLDISDAAETELARITRPEIVEKIRAKQASKPTGSALPIATLPTPTADRLADWQPIETAPYETPVRVKVASLGEMTFCAILLPDASMTDEEKSCDQWQAVHEGEHPPCWSGGACWESNEDESMSLQPIAWQPL